MVNKQSGPYRSSIYLIIFLKDIVAWLGMHGSNINEGQPQQTLCQWQQLCHITLVHLISRSCSLDKFTLNLLLGIVLGHFTILGAYYLCKMTLKVFACSLLIPSCLRLLSFFLHFFPFINCDIVNKLKTHMQAPCILCFINFAFL